VTDAELVALAVCQASMGIPSDRQFLGFLSGTELAAFTGQPVRKVGERDLVVCVVAGATGAITVSGTLAACRTVGIRVMATGGIGGVHRGSGDTLDVSADLGALARTAAVVVCSGAKSLLDGAATFEALETLAVPVLGWRADALPAFYSREGLAPVSSRVESAAEVARVARAHWVLRPSGALLVARPPDPEIPGAEVERLTQRALAAAAAAAGISGAAVTPRLHTLSGGRTLDVNRALILDNARLAAEIAVALA
jgi:pseudouridine-5'-phosphate glycosidase